MKTRNVLLFFLLFAFVVSSIVFSGCPQASSGSGGSGGSGGTVTVITAISQIPAGTWKYSATKSEYISLLKKTYNIPVTVKIVTTGGSTATFTLVADYTYVVTDATSTNGGSVGGNWTAYRSTVGTNYAGYGTVTYSSTSPYTVTATSQKTDKDIAGKTLTLTGTTTLSIPIPDLSSGNDSIWLFTLQ